MALVNHIGCSFQWPLSTIFILYQTGTNAARKTALWPIHMFFYDSLILHTRCSKNSTGLWISEQAAKQIFLSLRLVCCDAAVGIDGKTCHELSKCAEVHVMHAKGDFLTESESYAMIQTSFTP